MQIIYNRQESLSSSLPGLNMLRLVFLFCLIFASFASSGQVIISLQSEWKYATEGTTPATGWNKQANFNETGWNSGSAPFGFGSTIAANSPTLKSREKPLEPPSETNKNYPVYYFRKKFQITNKEGLIGLKLTVKYDDAVVVYLKDKEFKSSNWKPNTATNEGAYYGNPTIGTAPGVLEVPIDPSDLVNGENLIAVSLHQGGSQSSDAYFDLQLEGISLTRYPYLQLPSHDQMTVRWYTNIPTTSTVRYSTSETMSNPIDSVVNTSNTLHSVTLAGLYSNKTYYYLVGYGTGSGFVALQNEPLLTQFKTLPPPWETTSSPMRFWLLGDSGASQGNNPRPFYVRDAYLKYLEGQGNPQVHSILFLGDNSHTQNLEGLQEALDTTFFRFYNRPYNDQPLKRYKQLLSHLPSWTVMGNHDYEPDLTKIVTIPRQTDIIKKLYHKQTAASFSTFAFPEKGEIGGEPTNNKKGYYSFDQGNIHFVVLNPYLIETDNTNDMWMDGIEIHSSKSISLDNELNSPIDDLPQVAWLIRDLIRNKKKWTVVTFHQPPFSTIGHFSEPYPPHSDVYDKDLKRVKEKLMPILEKPEYHVDLVLVSHSHAYQRAGMIRVTNNQTHQRTTDYEATGGLLGNGNLGRYPTTAPYIKKVNEQAYTYILSGSSGRGVLGNVTGLDGNTVHIDDGGYSDTDKNKVRPVDFTTPKLDNLTGNATTKFYHETGGSVQLLFQENRLDVTFIRENNAAPGYRIDDSFVVMKDVNLTTPKNITKGGDIVTLKASWIGDYHWYSSESPTTELATDERELTLGPYKTTTYYVRDGHGHLQDTFVVNVANPTNPPTNETLVASGSQWLVPLSGGFATKGVNLAQQCIEPNFFIPPAFENPHSTIIGLGHGDEASRISNNLIEKIAIVAERLWFRRSFILNSSASAYQNFKLTLTLDKNTASGKNGTTYNSVLQTILINGQAVSIQSTQSQDIGQGRVRVTYTLNNQGFNLGVNHILISFYLYPSNSYFIDPQKDPFTFDAQLVSTPNASLPPAATGQFRLTKTTLPTQTVCAGDSLSIAFSAVGNESNFNLVYQAELVTSTGTTVLAEATSSPISVKLPTNLTGGSYTVRIVTKSAFMDQIETSAIAVKVLPQATIIPAPATSIWKGQTVPVHLSFAGGGPWRYVLSDATTGISLEDTQTVAVKLPVGLHTLILNSVSNGCGVGNSTGSIQVEVKEPKLTVDKVEALKISPFKNTLCEGDSVSVAYSVIGPTANRTYSVELSDATGSFATPTLLSSGITSPLRIKLPPTLNEGSQYKLRLLVANPDVDFTRNASQNQIIRKVATASMATDKVSVLTNEEVNITLNFTGSAPWYYFLRYGADTLRGSVTQAILNRMVKLNETQTFALDSVRNACGYGTVSGSRTVTVSLLVSLDPLNSEVITVYPNPTSHRLLLKNEQGWNGKLRWTISDLSGKTLSNGQVQPTKSGSPELDIQWLPTGTYLLRIEVGERRGVWKFIKE